MSKKAKKGAFDLRHHWFNPLWIRILIVVVLVAWTLFEVAMGNMLFAVIVGAATVYIGGDFLLDWEHVDPDDDGD